MIMIILPLGVYNFAVLPLVQVPKLYKVRRNSLFPLHVALLYQPTDS